MKVNKSKFKEDRQFSRQEVDLLSNLCDELEFNNIKYLCRDVWGYVYGYTDKPNWEPTIDGWRGGEEYYNPGRWEETSSARRVTDDLETSVKLAWEVIHNSELPSSSGNTGWYCSANKLLNDLNKAIDWDLWL